MTSHRALRWTVFLIWAVIVFCLLVSVGIVVYDVGKTIFS